MEAMVLMAWGVLAQFLVLQIVGVSTRRYVAHGGVSSGPCSSDDPCGSIETAVGVAQSNDTIVLVAGPTSPPPPFVVNSTNGVVVDKPLHIVGKGDVTVMCSLLGHHAFTFDTPHIDVQAIRFVGCHGPNQGPLHAGGAISAPVAQLTDGAHIRFVDLSFLNCTSAAGAGIFLSWEVGAVDTHVLLQRVSCSGNTAVYGGCVFVGLLNAVNSSVTILDSEFVGNEAAAQGGAINVQLEALANVSIRFEGCTFRRNTAHQGGGLEVVSLSNSSFLALSVERTVFDNNRASISGGGMYFGHTTVDPSVIMAHTNLTIRDTQFTQNSAAASESFGGGMMVRWHFIRDSHFLWDNVLFQSNAVVVAGAGISFQSVGTGANNVFHMSRCHFVSNVANIEFGFGAALSFFAYGRNLGFVMNTTLRMDSCEVHNNVGAQGTINIVIPGGDGVRVAIRDTAVADNAADANGAGLYVVLPVDRYYGTVDLQVNQGTVQRRWIANSTVLLERVTLTRNLCTGATGRGGAASITNGHITVRGCMITSNLAGRQGGGLEVLGTASLLMEESVIAQNRAAAVGALRVVSSGTVVLRSTIFHLLFGSPGETKDEVVLSGLSNITVESSVSFSCPVGGRLLYTHVPPFGGPPVHFTNLPVDFVAWQPVVTFVAHIACSECPGHAYSLRAGELHGPLRAYTPLRCHGCPPLASCHGGDNVSAIGNVWGGTTHVSTAGGDDTTMFFTRCPLGYCGKGLDRNTVWNHTCADGRVGTLCSHCAPDHSQLLGAARCVPNSTCGDGTWFFPVSVLLSFCYVLLLLFIPVAGSALQSVVLFYQISDLIVSGDLWQPLFALFRLSLNSTDGLCVVRGLSTLGSFLLEFFPPLLLFAVLLAVFVVSRVLGLGRDERREPGPVEPWDDEATSPTDVPLVRPLGRQKRRHGDVGFAGALDFMPSSLYPAGARTDRCRLSSVQEALSLESFFRVTVLLVVLTYKSYIYATFSLLHCVHVAPVQHAKLLLFRAASVECYTGWQFLVFALMGVLALLPAMLLFFYRRTSYAFGSRIYERFQYLPTWVRPLYEVTIEPYRPGAQFFHAWVIGELVVFSALFTFVRNRASVAIAFAVLSGVSLTVQALVHPFWHVYHNALRTTCCLSWVGLSLVSLADADAATLAAGVGERARLPSTGLLTGILLLFPLLATVAILAGRCKSWCRRED